MTTTRKPQNHKRISAWAAAVRQRMQTSMRASQKYLRLVRSTYPLWGPIASRTALWLWKRYNENEPK